MAETEAETEVETPKAKPALSLPRWTPSLPTGLVSMLNTFAGDDTVRPDSNTTTTPSVKKASFFSTIFPNSPDAPSTVTAATPHLPPQDDDSVMFAEPDTRSNSDQGSRDGSVHESRLQRSRNCDKSKTCFSICHPPPTSTKRHRLHRRPRPVLQLHRLCCDARPKPAFDVIHSANFSVKLTKVITKVFRAKHRLCPNDLVILKAEKYAVDEPDEEREASDVIALICKGRKEDGQYTGKAKLCFADGREWEAYATPTGGYEFFTTDEHGLGITMRWVPKRNKDGSRSLVDSDKRRFNFSTISPNSRRHPVIACLSRTSLDVNDSFKIPDASTVTPLSTPNQGSTILADTASEEALGGNQCVTDDRLRETIVVSGIWVAFKEGWSLTFKYDDRDKENMSLQRSPSKAGASVNSLLSTPPASPGPMSPALEKRNSTQSVPSAGLWRRGSLLAKSNRDSVPAEEFQALPSAHLDAARTTGRTRADSASTVLVHRAASNRARNQAGSRQEALASQPGIKEAPSLESFARSQSDGAVELSAPAQRRESLARSILPTVEDSNSHVPEAGAAKTAATSSRRRRRRSPAVGKRESSATSATTTSTTEALRKPPAYAKKKSGLRRLLCGGGH